MACKLKHTCNFLFSFFQCALPNDTIDIEFTVRIVKGIHPYRKDNTSKQVTCSSCSRQMKPFLSLQKKIEAYEEEKRDQNSPFLPNPLQFKKKNISTKRSRERSYRRSKQRKLDMGHFTPSKAKRLAFSWAPLPATNTTTTTTTTSHPMTSSCKTCKRWQPSGPFCAQSTTYPSSQESD